MSNCLSVQPLDTPLGRRTRIDQDSCNLDFSCVKGDCPSFMEVELDAEQPRDGELDEGVALGPARPGRPRSRGDVVRVRLAGIGGTGVVTTAQMLGTAAMLDGWRVQGLDQTGLSQKAGPVISDVVLTRGDAESTNLIGDGQTTTLLALDGLVGASDPVLAACDPATTRVVLSTTRTPTGRMVSEPTTVYPGDDVVAARLGAVSRDVLAGDAGRTARVLLGDAAYANVLVLGAALQAGAVPVSLATLRRAVELNGVAVDANLRALDWGRAWAADPQRVERLVASRRVAAGELLSVPPLPDALRRRVDGLGLRRRDRRGRAACSPRTSSATRTPATPAACSTSSTGSRPPSTRSRASRGSGSPRPSPATCTSSWPTRTSTRSPASCSCPRRTPRRPRPARGAVRSCCTRRRSRRSAGVDKVRFDDRSRPVFASLAAGRRLRGTRLDPFGATEVRRTERALVGEYVGLVRLLVDGLTAATHARAVEVAGMADSIRGYEDLKMRRVAEYRAAVAEAVAGWPAPRG